MAERKNFHEEDSNGIHKNKKQVFKEKEQSDSIKRNHNVGIKNIKNSSEQRGPFLNAQKNVYGTVDDYIPITLGRWPGVTNQTNNQQILPQRMVNYSNRLSNTIKQNPTRKIIENPKQHSSNLKTVSPSYKRSDLRQGSVKVAMRLEKDIVVNTQKKGTHHIRDSRGALMKTAIRKEPIAKERVLENKIEERNINTIKNPFGCIKNPLFIPTYKKETADTMKRIKKNSCKYIPTEAYNYREAYDRMIKKQNMQNISEFPSNVSSCKNMKKTELNQNQQSQKSIILPEVFSKVATPVALHGRALYVVSTETNYKPGSDIENYGSSKQGSIEPRVNKTSLRKATPAAKMFRKNILSKDSSSLASEGNPSSLSKEMKVVTEESQLQLKGYYQNHSVAKKNDESFHNTIPSSNPLQKVVVRNCTGDIIKNSIKVRVLEKKLQDKTYNDKLTHSSIQTTHEEESKSTKGISPNISSGNLSNAHSTYHYVEYQTNKNPLEQKDITKMYVSSNKIEMSRIESPKVRKSRMNLTTSNRGGFNYSAVLTSMVSSILTQQNEIKIEENNFIYKDRMYQSNPSYGKNTNYMQHSQYENKEKVEDTNLNESNYEYTLLNQVLEHEQKEKTISRTQTNDSSNPPRDKLLYLALIVMICISVLCNYDHGAIPVTLGEIQKDFPLSYIEQSLLGSLVYFGLIIGTIIAGVLFELFPAKVLVTVSIMLLSISLYVFSHANCITFMYISRFVNGLCQAIPVVYLPVWVDEFSPEQKATQWMSYIQLASIGGTVFGYFLGGILSNTDSDAKLDTGFSFYRLFFSTWRSPFLIQAFLLLPICIIMLFIPSDKINITSNDIEIDEYNDDNIHTELGDMEKQNYQKERKGSSFKENKEKISGNKTSRSKINFNRSATYIMEKKTNVLKKTLKEVKKLLKNKLYIIITLGMSNLYFVVTGIQFWITEYMSVVLLTEKIKIVTVSTLCFLTSPTSGVWFGGYICDFFGGYKNTNYTKTIKVATAFAISACIFGIMSAHLTNVIFFSISLWLCLFNGSALVPVAVGMLLSCVDNHQKSLSSAISQIIYNVFGWFAAPLLSGAIMDIMHKYTHDNRLALKAGFTMILYSSTIGFLLLFYANFLDLSDKKVNEDSLELAEPLK